MGIGKSTPFPLYSIKYVKKTLYVFWSPVIYSKWDFKSRLWSAAI